MISNEIIIKFVFIANLKLLELLFEKIYKFNFL